MKAAVAHRQRASRSATCPSRSPKPSEVLVRVRAAGLNRADLPMAAGHMHGSAGGAGTILGLECAGEVVEVGAEVQRRQAGRPGDVLAAPAAMPNMPSPTGAASRASPPTT